MTGRLAELSYIRAREDLLQSFDFTKKHKSPFENASYPTKGDMRVILQRHKEGKTTDEEKINKRRNVIRNTWTNNTFINGYTVKRIFIFGQGNDSNDVNAALKSEAALFGDILQMNLVDSHRNSTWKSRGGLKWASENCFGAKYVMLVDDDYYVATDLVIQLLEFTGKLDNLYMGVVNWRPSPFRSKIRKLSNLKKKP
ncbi:beta-1,3-galactosyltransferase 4-like [Ylistrum balloti]|uniref:beta-1,3-galactosyltransferase 4-like n=1 Tax=Ylistrum balloti TaxID=509963 RepID=UPI002905C082|nr:beta-1,3-galactosyltransferase 4-like [Ylistrum balloti]